MQEIISICLLHSGSFKWQDAAWLWQTAYQTSSRLKKYERNKNLLLFSWPAAHPEGLHMTSMDVCCNDQWFMPGPKLFKLCPRQKQLLPTLSTTAELECHHRGQLGNASPLFSALPQPSLLYKCQLTTTDTDGEQKHRRTGKWTEPPTGVRKQEDSTHTVQERILPDNIIIYFKLFYFFLFLIFSFFYFFKLFIFFQHMPYENLGIIKVPERIARFSACIAVRIYRFVQRWAKNRLLYSTGFIYIQVRGRGRCHNYRCGGEGSHA